MKNTEKLSPLFNVQYSFSFFSFVLPSLKMKQIETERNVFLVSGGLVYIFT